MNYYYVFGLQVQSEILLPELLTSRKDTTPDVIISIGKTPNNLANCQKKGVTYEVATNEFLLDLKEIARFYVKNGDTIIIEPKTKKNLNDIRLFLLGSCFGAILHQRKILTMHASAIAHEGAAVLFTGISGAGKSTTANAFRLQGYKMLTDDVCPIQIINGKPFALSSYPQSKLWEDTLEELNVDFEQFRHIRKGINKRAIPIIADFERKPMRIKAMYLLQPHNNDTIELIDVQDSTKFNLIKNMTYRKYLIKDLGVQPYHFINGSHLANNIPIRRVLRPQTFCLEQVLTLIKEDLETLKVTVI